MGAWGHPGCSGEAEVISDPLLVSPSCHLSRGGEPFSRNGMLLSSRFWTSAFAMATGGPGPRTLKKYTVYHVPHP